MNTVQEEGMAEAAKRKDNIRSQLVQDEWLGVSGLQ